MKKEKLQKKKPKSCNADQKWKRKKNPFTKATHCNYNNQHNKPTRATNNKTTK